MATTLLDKETRILVLAPIGRDGAATADLIRGGGLAADVCTGLDDLARQLDAGAGAALIAEEALFGVHLHPLATWVERQPPWSDLHFILVTSRQDQPAIVPWREGIARALRNVSLLERPIQPVTLRSVVQAAVAARRRQYELRAHIAARQRAASDLEALVVARTRELAAKNEELRSEIAERARIEEALRQSQKIEALGQLTGGVAHDFNNLLMVITAGLEMMERIHDQARLRQLLDRMRQAAQRGASLTRQLLAFSRSQPLRPEPLNLVRKVGDMRELLDHSLRGDVEVTTDFAPGLWAIEADPGELELAILNLAVNARDALPHGGVIRIRAENAPRPNGMSRDFVRLMVVDEGTGMPPSVVTRVFEPFFTTKDVGKGSGLGLPQVYGFARASGGWVDIDSTVGQGTTVSIWLPRSAVAPASTTADAATASRPAGQGPSKGHVLLVEDDDEVAALVGEMLAQIGYGVTRVASAAAGLGALANGRIVDAVLSDVMMPGGMSGVDLVREARRRRPGLPVVLMSGHADAVLAQARQENIPLLVKPYRLDTLAAMLHAAIDPRAVAGG